MADRDPKDSETPDAPQSQPIKPGSADIATAKGAAYASEGAHAAPARYQAKIDEPAVMLRRSLMDDAEVLGADAIEVFVPGGKSKHIDVGPRRPAAPSLPFEIAAPIAPQAASFDVDVNAPLRPATPAVRRPEAGRSFERFVIAVLVTLLIAVAGVLAFLLRGR